MAISNIAFGQPCNAPAQLLLTYAEQPSSPAAAPVLCSPLGRAYRVSFTPRLDVEQGASELDLVLQSAEETGMKRKNSNLLIENSHWHGYQPYTFGAADYTNGAEGSVFGKRRTIVIPGTEMQLIVDVLDAKVVAEKPNMLGQVDYQFFKLSLQISMKAIDK